MRIAVIQDGTELARQTDADISGVFERCCELLAADGLDASAAYVTDDMATGLIEQLDPDAYACVVVASNALNAGRVERALTQGRARLRSYLDAGGGLVLLQQIVTDLSVLPLDQVPGFTERGSPHGAATAGSLARRRCTTVPCPPVPCLTRSSRSWPTATMSSSPAATITRSSGWSSPPRRWTGSGHTTC